MNNIQYDPKKRKVYIEKLTDVELVTIQKDMNKNPFTVPYISFPSNKPFSHYKTSSDFSAIKTLDDKLVGCITVDDNGYRAIDMTIYILEEHRKSGYASEAMLLVEALNFGTSPTNKIRNSVYSGNTAFIKLHEKLGFTVEAVKKDFVMIGGVLQDSITYVKTSSTLITQVRGEVDYTLDIDVAKQVEDLINKHFEAYGSDSLNDVPMMYFKEMLKKEKWIISPSIAKEDTTTDDIKGITIAEMIKTINNKYPKTYSVDALKSLSVVELEAVYEKRIIVKTAYYMTSNEMIKELITNYKTESPCIKDLDAMGRGELERTYNLITNRITI